MRSRKRDDGKKAEECRVKIELLVRKSKFLDPKIYSAILRLLLHGSAYQEWLRGQALRRHSNLAQLPRC